MPRRSPLRQLALECAAALVAMIVAASAVAAQQQTLPPVTPPPPTIGAAATTTPTPATADDNAASTNDDANGFSQNYVIITAVGASLLAFTLIAGAIVCLRRRHDRHAPPERHESYVSQQSARSHDTVPASVQLDSRVARHVKPPRSSDEDDDDGPKAAWSSGGVVLEGTPGSEELAIAKQRSLSIVSASSHPSTAAQGSKSTETSQGSNDPHRVPEESKAEVNESDL